MDDVKLTKSAIREQVSAALGETDPSELDTKTRKIEDQLFEFANFLESRIVLLYVNKPLEVDTRGIIVRSFDYNKIVILPAFNPQTFQTVLLKVDHPDRDLKPGPRGILEPDPHRCKTVPVDCVDIAIIPGIAFDEKGGRVGSGEGYYDRFIPDLALTTRKVSIALESQILPVVPMESHDRFIDIIISEKRVIYKI